jgi:tRNA (guanine9-N1)-methyltransferase
VLTKQTMADLEERPSKIRKLDPISTDKNGSLDEITVSGIEGLIGDQGADPSLRASKASTLALTEDDERIMAKELQGLSKNQLKRIKKKEEWEAGREHRKAKRKEREKEKKARKAEERAVVQKEAGEAAASAPALPQRGRPRPTLVPVTLLLDCDFDELMTNKEIISLASQLTRCYSSNRGAPYKAHLAISSFTGQLKQRFETVLANHHQGWKGVMFTEDDFVTAAETAHAAMCSSTRGQLVGALAGSAFAFNTPQQPNPDAIILEQHPEAGAHGAGDNMPKQNIPGQEKQPPEDASSTANPLGGKPSGVKNGNIENGTETEGISPNRSLRVELAANSELPEASEGKHLRSTNSPQQEPISQESAGVRSSDILGESCTSAPEKNSKSDPSPSKPSVIYLTSDSPHTLDILVPYTSYVIGGLVDKNRHKGVCFKRACMRHIPTAKLPIGEYMTMQSRSVLATNHVVEIMVRWLEHGDWAKAFTEVIPKRKLAKLKTGAGGCDEEGDEDAGDSPADHLDANGEVEETRDGKEDMAD